MSGNEELDLPQKKPPNSRQKKDPHFAKAAAQLQSQQYWDSAEHEMQKAKNPNPEAKAKLLASASQKPHVAFPQ